ncbi:hypothetical protein M0638_20890 [Roseomonas sp. NAR14]|uniref:Uncharacterized protein n=1 Tax=Roseomonas acroporae TaxID=2937791 RepID=A0A9X1YCX2_9PROT|nr:hypothetical protein [Roseomonas acroporae]MCK8786833.1 hypothetical protein [Roseomonas acroporae]
MAPPRAAGGVSLPLSLRDAHDLRRAARVLLELGARLDALSRSGRPIPGQLAEARQAARLADEQLRARPCGACL